MSLRNPQQNFDNATMLDAVMLELSIALKEKLSWLKNCYTIAHKLVKEQNKKKIYYPGVFVGGEKSNKYLDLRPDGGLENYSFFRVNDPEDIQYYARNVNKITVNFDLIIWFNLKKVYPNDTGRNIENVKYEVLKAFRQIVITRGSYILNRVYRESDNIFRGYTMDESKEQYMMHPYGALMINGNLIYKENC